MTDCLVHVVSQSKISGDGDLDGIQRPGLVRKVGQVVPPELVDDFVGYVGDAVLGYLHG